MTARICLISAVLLVAACDSTPPTDVPGPSFAAVTNTFNDWIPVNVAVINPCALGGAGEVVVLSGTLHALLHVTFDAAGGIHLMAHIQPQVSGTGLASGDRYRGTGVARGQLNVRPGGPQTLTFIANLRIIGQSPGNDFLVHHNVHVTINANGDITATVDNFSADCR